MGNPSVGGGRRYRSILFLYPFLSCSQLRGYFRKRGRTVPSVVSLPIPRGRRLRGNRQSHERQHGHKFHCLNFHGWLLHHQVCGSRHLWVEVSQTGFKTQVVNNVVVQTALNPTVNIALTLGAVAQTVNVTDTTSLVEMQTADGGAVIDTKRVDDVPTQQRNSFGLVYVAPSVVPTSTEKSFTLEETPSRAAKPSMAAKLASSPLRKPTTF